MTYKRKTPGRSHGAGVSPGQGQDKDITQEAIRQLVRRCAIAYFQRHPTRTFAMIQLPPAYALVLERRGQRIVARTVVLRGVPLIVAQTLNAHPDGDAALRAFVSLLQSGGGGGNANSELASALLIAVSSGELSSC